MEGNSTQTPNSGDRNRSRLRDAANHFQHFVWTNVLPIRITKHGGDASAGRGQGGKARLPGAHAIPCVGQHKNFWSVMEIAKGGGFGALLGWVHLET